MNYRFKMLGTMAVAFVLPMVAAGDDLYVGADATYKTIQEAVDAAESGDVIHIAAGIYDEGCAEPMSGSVTSNRVAIVNKPQLTLIGAGRGKTIIRGSRPAGTGDAFSANATAASGAVRCLMIYNSSDVLIKNITFERGEAHGTNVNSGENGGAVYAYGSWRSADRFVDCEFTDSSATTGGLVDGGTYVRCRFTDGFGGFSGVADQATLVNCAISRSVSDGAGKALLRGCSLYNCTIADCRSAYNLINGATASSNTKVVNCLIMLSTYSYLTGTSGTFDMDGTIVSTTAAHGDWQVMAPTLGDFSPLPEADVFAASAYTNLDAVTLPAGISKYVDLNGQPIVADAEGKITAGAVQTAGVPAAGTLVFTGGTSFPVVNGRRSRCKTYLSWICPTNYPVSYKISSVPYNTGASFFRWQRSIVDSGAQDGGYTYASLDGSEWVMPPPDVAVTNTYTADIITDRLWVDEKNGDDSTGAMNREDLPFQTIQGAVTKAASSWNRIIYVKPGWYTNGLSSAGASTRIYVNSGKVLIRSTGGADVTFLCGAPASSANQFDSEKYPGAGSDAIVAFGSKAECALQGFTILNSYAHDSTSGALDCNGKAQLLDCVISNCVSCGYAVQAHCTRCQFHNITSKQDVVVGNTSACYLRDNTVVDENFGGVRGSAIFCTVVGPVQSDYISSQVSSFNSIYDGGTKVATNWKPFGSIFWNYGECGVSTDLFIHADPVFVDRTSSPQVYGCSPAVAAGVYPTVANTTDVKWYLYCHGDLYGNAIDWGVAGAPTIGACQTSVKPCLYVEQPENGGIALEGTSFGPSALTDSTSITVTPAVGTRPCIGVTVNGTVRPFTNFWSEAHGRYEIPVTAADAVDGVLTVKAVYSTDWYVDDDGDDANSGSLPKAAKKTLVAGEAMMAANDTLWVLPGTYDSGSNHVNDATIWSRLVVNKNHTVISTDGPEKTFIVGQNATIEPDEYGCGTNAMRCVTLRQHATLSGFTLTGGRVNCAFLTAVDGIGAGVLGENGTDPSYGVRVENCIISNCVASIGAAAARVLIARSRMLENTAKNYGSAAYQSSVYGCFADNNCGDGVIDHTYAIVDTTVGGGNWRSDGKTPTAVQAMANQWANTIVNSLFLLPVQLTDSRPYTIRYSAMPDTSVLAGNVLDDTCIVTNVDCLALEDNGRPKIGVNVAIDKGSLADFDDEYGFLDPDRDTSGFQRIMNGAMDMGCYEGDWSERYAKDLGSSRYLNVYDVSPGVCEDAETHDVTLPANATMAFDWSAPSYLFTFRVTSGTLYVSYDGGDPVPYTTGEYEVHTPANAKHFVLTTSADGAATLLKFRRNVGTIIVVR